MTACQTTAPKESPHTPATIGDWTVETSGSVRADGGYVR
jgi:hypothetical protein